MAVNWLLALKAVPWTDVVRAAPAIVKGARKLFDSARESEAPPVGPAHDRGPPGSVQARLSEIEAALQTLDAEQDSSAELIRSLAEQHARVVQAIEVLRARTRLLIGLNVALLVAVAIMAIWLITQ